MASKKQPHNLPSPTNSSDSETDSQERSTSSGDFDSDSQPQQLTQPTPQQAPHQDSSESESDSEDDSEDESDQTQKPLSPEPKKPVSKPTELKANGKRPAEIDQMVSKSKKSKGVEIVDKGSKSVDEKVDKGWKSVDEKVEKGWKSVVEKVKKGKVSNGEEEGGEIEDKKANLFERLFTENDEIVLLEGMIDFKEKNNGGDPSLNIGAFHDSVEDLLSCSVTKSQIVDKIRRLKKKYVNHLKKGKGGEDRVISRSHEFKSFELSKKIWGSGDLGSEVNGDSKVKGSSRKKDDNAGSKMPLKSVGKESELKEEVKSEVLEEVKSEVVTEDWWSLYPLLCASLEAEAIKNFTGLMSAKEYVKKVVSGLNKEKARELEHEWKDCSVMEHQVYAKKLKVRSNLAEAAMNVIQH